MSTRSIDCGVAMWQCSLGHKMRILFLWSATISFKHLPYITRGADRLDLSTKLVGGT